MDVRLEVRLCVVARAEVLVRLLELLRVLDHLVDLRARQTADRVGDADRRLAAGRAVHRGDLEQTVRVDLEGGDELGLATGHGRDTSELELAEQTVVAALGALTLVAELHNQRHELSLETEQKRLHREGDRRLVVLDGGEGTRLVGRDGRVTGHNDTENVTLHGNTERERCNVEKKQVLSLLGRLASENGGLDGSTVCDGLVGVDRLVQLAAAEELGDERLDLGDTGRAADEDDVVDLLARDLGVLENLLDGLHGRLEEGGVDLLEAGTGDVGGEVLALEHEMMRICSDWSRIFAYLVERVDLNVGLSDRRKSALGTLACRAETTEGTSIVRDVELGLARELLLEVLEEGVVEVLTTQVGVTGSRLDGEDTTGDVEERDIESASAEIEDEHVALRLGLLVESTLR